MCFCSVVLGPGGFGEGGGEVVEGIGEAEGELQQRPEPSGFGLGAAAQRASGRQAFLRQAGLALPVGAYTCDLPQGGDEGCGDAGLGKLGDRDFLAVEGGEADQMAAEHFGVDFVADEEALNDAPGVVALPAQLEGPELP